MPPSPGRTASVFPTHSSNLTLRSGPRGRVSKGGQRARTRCPCFETLAALAPQHEVFVVGPPSAIPSSSETPILIGGGRRIFSEALASYIASRVHRCSAIGGSRATAPT